MAEVRFTPAQESAIYADNRELLVSAAAGSGKTAVLVERILRLIRDHHIDINRMLVVTYTRAAAAELRERLELRLQAAAAEDAAMHRQIDLLAGAQISTIHSYCQHVVREHFRHCGVDPQFSMADERTSNALYQESLNEVLDAAYAAATDDEDLKALLSVLQEKQLVSVIQLTYDFLMTRPDPIGWLREQTEIIWTEDTLREHPLSRTLLDECALLLENARVLWSQAQSLLDDPEFPEKFAKTIQQDDDVITSLEEACANGVATLCSASRKFATIAKVKPETDAAAVLTDQFKNLREEYKDCVKELQKVLPGNLASALEDLEKMRPAARGLCWVMNALLESYRTHKQERAVLDFHDLEHMTLEILGEPELSELESNRFDAVFVDEYQDVSAIQEAILNGLKRSTGKQFFFYVGDVKQSIYRFRQAEPTLFLSKLNTFSDEEDAPLRRIILNRNFRSRETVLAAVNQVFTHVMDSRVTEIDYDDSAKLYPGKPSTGDPIAELHLLGGVGKRESILKQAQWIAQDIQRTVGTPVTDANGQPGQPLRYRDIVILLPVAKGVADKVEVELTKAGIPVYVDASMNAMGSEEVVQLCQHLLLLDNLRNDLALISELRSPLFDLSERELAEIRLQLPDDKRTFYDAMMVCAQQEENQPLRQRCQSLLDFLEQERFLCRSMPVEEYLWDFLMRSGLYAHYGCQPGGKLRQANLRMLCHKAGEYAAAHTEGMSGFLSTLHQGGDSTSPTVVNPWEDVVRIMTIHKSKGLEFPTVYLMGLEDPVIKRTNLKSISMHGSLGLSLMYMNARSRTKRTTLLQNVIGLRNKAEARAEKARVLYVAMTRPKNRLVMVAVGEETEEDALRMIRSRRAGGKLSLVRKAKTLYEWVLQSAEDTALESCDNGMNPSCTGLASFESGEAFSTVSMWETSGNQHSSTIPTCFPQKTGVLKVVFHIDTDKSTGSQQQENVNMQTDVNLLPFDNILPTVSETVDPLTPLRRQEPTPLKVGVTALVRAMQEAAPIDAEEDTPERKRYPLITRPPKLLSSLPEKPEFLLPRQEDAALQRGVCTHLLLSTVDIDFARRAITEGNVIEFLEAHRENLRLSGKFSIEEASVADVRMAARFLTSEEGRNMLNSKEIRREWPFNLRITQPIQTMVQGVIDLCYLEEDEWVLVDFKTDYVKDESELWERYRLQLDLYRQALEKSTGRKVRRCGLFSLRLGKLITG
ncbi:MAG: helicase-exonuclease AddAB subunit AddA [Clostridia bacterium]|nr:helicase-exonuclease AddAB subunit AddA [Clostridia bacterium]